MTDPSKKKVTFEITLTVTDPAAMQAEALRCYLAGGGQEENFVEHERIEDKMEDTPIGAWVEALFDSRIRAWLQRTFVPRQQQRILPATTAAERV